MPLVRDGKSKRRSDPFPAPRSPLMSVLSSPRSPMSSRQAVAGGFRALVPSTRGKPITPSPAATDLRKKQFPFVGNPLAPYSQAAERSVACSRSEATSRQG
jgi:hypothetical protein